MYTVRIDSIRKQINISEINISNQTTENYCNISKKNIEFMQKLNDSCYMYTIKDPNSIISYSSIRNSVFAIIFHSQTKTCLIIQPI